MFLVGMREARSGEDRYSRIQVSVDEHYRALSSLLDIISSNPEERNYLTPGRHISLFTDKFFIVERDLCKRILIESIYKSRPMFIVSDDFKTIYSYMKDFLGQRYIWRLEYNKKEKEPDEIITTYYLANSCENLNCFLSNENSVKHPCIDRQGFFHIGLGIFRELRHAAGLYDDISRF